VPETRPVPGAPQEWIARAKGDLALAQAPLSEGGFYEDLCFHRAASGGEGSQIGLYALAWGLPLQASRTLTNWYGTNALGNAKE
jgi:hypothetical protein